MLFDLGHVERLGDARQLLLQRRKLRGQIAHRALLLRDAHVAGVDVLLRERGALLRGREARLQFLAAIARGGEVLGVLLRLRGERRDLALKIGAHLLQGVDVVLQACDLAQLQLDLVLAGRDRALRLGESSLALAELLRRLVGLGRKLLHLRRQRIALLRRRCELRGEPRHIEGEIGILAALQRQDIGELVDLVGELLQRRVAPRERVGQIELSRREDEQDEDDDHDELRQRIDEARPDVDAAAFGPPRGARHGL